MKFLLCLALVCAAAVAQPTDKNDKLPELPSSTSSPSSTNIYNETASESSNINHRVERDDDHSKMPLDQTSNSPSKFRENNRGPKTDSKATNDKPR